MKLTNGLIAVDNFLEEYAMIKEWLHKSGKFNKIQVGKDDHFEICKIPGFIQKVMMSEIGRHFKKRVEPVNSFFRLDYEGNTDVRIHIDSMMNCNFAMVMAFSTVPVSSDEINGVALWNHNKYGPKFQLNVKEDIKESNRLLREESHDITKFTLDSIVGHKENRAIIYAPSRFHSRYPFKAWGSGKKDGRIVWVCFFNMVTEDNIYGKKTNK